MADYGGSTTPELTRDQTRTPLWLFDALDREFDFALDAAAMPDTALVPDAYLTPAENSLVVPWADQLHPMRSNSNVWLNPPYSDITPWVTKAKAERRNGLTTVMLVPMDATAGWWPGTEAQELRIITGYNDARGKWRSGRIDFIHPVTGKEMKGNPKGSCFLIFRPEVETHSLKYVTKGSLMVPDTLQVAA
ncbi:phage N-6-adenine-methyltransferase [Oceanisphaera litoralis]|uniref:phage N-6-adenine-methyltransferase n=1 Tax=Oceanisphaera litoralis TaxID=225144 RepID=UPI00195DE16A|nr:phage N-6-adenine-methyltransferase [Oceanisphaera litoralis]MBM7454522.1 phage N-6-adenine-methyltransferase [Oceanisphaera litoralis]